MLVAAVRVVNHLNLQQLVSQVALVVEEMVETIQTETVQQELVILVEGAEDALPHLEVMMVMVLLEDLV
tara:strand:- start:116 stop:322 length:207 start_codon:yes stop_codon:yes gene_type:complete